MPGVVVVHWKKKGLYEAYSSIIGFCEYTEPLFKEKDIRKAMRVSNIFENEDIVLIRCPIFGRIKRRKSNS